MRRGSVLSLSMHNQMIFFSFLTLSVLFSACRTTSTLKPDSRTCTKNFSYDGSFLAGRTFKAFQEFPEVNNEVAFDRAIEVVISDGWQIISSDKKQGIISASQTVSYGEGQTVPLNILVRQLDSGGSKVSIVFSISGGMSTSVNSVRDFFCLILEAVGNHPGSNK